MRIPSHTTVIAYLALFVALGTGGAYAVDRITGDEIKNGTIRSVDLKDRQAVTGADVKRDSLTGGAIREDSLDASKFAPMAGVNDAGDCDPTTAVAIDCVSVTLVLTRPARIYATATGGTYSAGGSPPVRGECEIRINGGLRPTALPIGEISDGTAAEATDGFARTLVTENPLPAGSHKVALACSELDPDVRIATPTIAALAISE